MGIKKNNSDTLEIQPYIIHINIFIQQHSREKSSDLLRQERFRCHFNRTIIVDERNVQAAKIQIRLFVVI